MQIKKFIALTMALCLALALANVGGRANSVKLLLAGSALSAVCGAFSSFLIHIIYSRKGNECHEEDCHAELSENQ